MANEPECPECERLHEVAPQSQVVGEFLEWLQVEKGFVLGNYHEHSDECDGEDRFRTCGLRSGELFPVRISIEKLLAEFFKIDLTKVENERRALLDHLANRE